MATLAEQHEAKFDEMAAIEENDPNEKKAQIAEKFAEIFEEAGVEFDIHGNVKLSGNVGFFGTDATSQPTVSGADADQKIASIIAALVALGLVTE